MTGQAKLDGLVRRAQWLAARLFSAPRAAAHLTPQEHAQAAQALSWLQEFIAQPHPDLGRKGPICPFVQSAIDRKQLSLAFDPATGESRAGLRWAVLQELVRFLRRTGGDREKWPLASSVIVFPALLPEHYELLDRLHDELKTQAMDAGVMMSSFHPRSVRPAIHNPAFHVLRAPLCAFALRLMDVRDIVFLSHNRRAFDRYRSLFGPLHARGAVSDEHGYATAYAEALRRFP